MRPRAIADLSQLKDKELFSKISQGMALVVSNADDLCRDAKTLLDQGQHRSSGESQV
jgi:hypothetical protein